MRIIKRTAGVLTPGTISTLLGTLAGALLLSGCGGQGGDKSAGGGGGSGGEQLVIVSPHGRSIQAEFERLFKEKHPNASIKWQDKGGTSDLLRLVIGEEKSQQGGLEADIFFGGGAETFLELEERGLLQPLDSDFGIPAKLNGVPLRGEKNQWVAAALSGFGILVNQSYAKRDNLPIPQTWEGLADPKLENRIELADPRKSGSAHTTYEVILQTNGWDKGWQILEGMAANSRRFIESSSDLLTDVTSGEAVMAPAIDFYGRRAIARAGADKDGQMKLAYVEPKGQSIVTPDPIGLLKNAPNAELAKDFIKLVMSPEGQKLWILKKGTPGGPKMESHGDEDGLYRMAALPAAYKPISKDSLIQSDPYAVKNQRPYDAAKGAQRRQALDALFGAVLIDSQQALKAARKKNPAIAYVPISEADLTKAAAKWDDAAFRNKITEEWRNAAKKKFGE